MRHTSALKSSTVFVMSLLPPPSIFTSTTISPRHHPLPSPCYLLSLNTYLILPRRLLTSLQLLHIPPTNVHIPTILIHTASKALDIVRAGTTCLLCRASISVVCTTSLSEVVLGRLSILICSWCLCGLGRTTAEEAADCVAD